MKFSVLMSLYYKEQPVWFDRSMQSIWDDQTIKPNEIVLVKDGPLSNELNNIVNNWQNKLGNILKVIELKSNVGLGNALNIGLKHCSYNLVARMDTDDMSVADRFKSQISAFSSFDIDICSSWVSEFDGSDNNITGVRKLPELHADIVNFAKIRCPINHPAVMYKKSAVLAAGSYKDMRWFEDYYLWARMIQDGARFYNIQQPLVHMRAGINQLSRRSGFDYAYREYLFLKELKSIGFLSTTEFVKMAVVRVPLRLLPKPLLKMVYKLLRVNR